MFKIPANTPISLQPLDKDGKALQIMRSWLVGMPGETLSCVGCHEDANSAPPGKRMKAMMKAPLKLTPFYGKARGFSYDREVQPVLDKYCVGCHSPQATHKPEVKALLKGSLRRFPTGNNADRLYREAGLPDFSRPSGSYDAVHPYVRRNGPEGDYHLLTPLEFHADTSPLIQMLEKGHHNVQLDKEAWDRLITWIDLNAPYSGTWSEVRSNKAHIKRRLELRKRYAGVAFNPEAILTPYKKVDNFVMPKPYDASKSVTVSGWPMTSEKAVDAQGDGASQAMDLGDDISLELVKIPSGTFVMGAVNESPMERPVSRVTIDKPFLMGAKEITLEQYRQFDPNYLNGVYDMHNKDQVHRGYYMNHMKFPVIRVSWEKANEYCTWLSNRIGKRVSLPTEAQWEWACRAGSDTPFSYGNLDVDFSQYANLADISKKYLAVSGVNPKPIRNPNRKQNYELKDERFNDRTLHLAPVGSYKANAWGLYDMHGNVAEWTCSDYKPYPYNGSKGECEKKVVRGGSWNDYPARATSSFRLGFPKWQQVYNVGFRIIVNE
jgi:formylglycine-generating enzyme required for sulfatase activity